MPTGGHHFGFDESEAQAIGSWTEIPAGSGHAQAKGPSLCPAIVQGARCILVGWQSAKCAMLSRGPELAQTGLHFVVASCEFSLKNGSVSKDAPAPALPDEGGSSSDAASWVLE